MGRDQRIVINSAQARQAPPTLDLPVLEDANSIQVALMQVMRLLISHQIDHKTAGLLLYALQTASFNLRRTDFEPVVKTKIVIDPTRVDETPLGESQWQNEDFETSEEPEEEDAEEAENGHLEIQAMAAPNPRSDRRPACPARKRRSNRLAPPLAWTSTLASRQPQRSFAPLDRRVACSYVGCGSPI